MRGLTYLGPREIAVRETSARPLAGGEVRVDVAACGVCGSDVFAYAGGLSIRVPGQVMGHEVAGRVSEVAVDVEGVAVGDPVVVNPIIRCGHCDFCVADLPNLCRTRKLYGCALPHPGAYADEIVVASGNLVAFTGDAPLERGSLAEPFAVGTHAARVAADLADLARVLVIGAGPIGLGAAFALRREGVTELLVSEPQQHRRAVLARFGFDIAEPDDVRRGEFDVAFDCVGLTPTLSAAVEAVRPRGQVMFVGLAEDRPSVPGHALETGERRIAGAACYTDQDFRDTVDWIAAAGPEFDTLIEARVDFDGLVSAFDSYARRENPALKTVLCP